MKECRGCKISKSLDEFALSRANKRDGRQSRCKQCNAEYRKANRERIKENNRSWSARNQEKKRAYNREYREANKDRLLTRNREYCKANREKLNAKQREYVRNNKEVVKAGYYRYMENNREKVNSRQRQYNRNNKEKIREYHRRRYRSCPVYKCNVATRRVLGNFLMSLGRRKTDSTHSMLGYTPAQLKATMEARFKPGMSWENHGKWHIDHKIPVSHFVKKGETRPHIVHALSNLQPLWAEDNISKGDKLPPPSSYS